MWHYCNFKKNVFSRKGNYSQKIANVDFLLCNIDYERKKEKINIISKK